MLFNKVPLPYIHKNNYSYFKRIRVVIKGKTGVYYFFHLRIVESSAAQILLFSMARAIVNLK